jgi:hypothetical protein
MAATLIIKPETLQIGAYGSVTGAIWLKIGEQAFPDEGWTDFVVTLLEWWTNGLLRLASNSRATEKVPFMDGPYGVWISISSPGVLHLRALAGSNLQNQVASGETDFAVFAQELVARGGEVIRICSQHDCRPDDQAGLEDSLRALEREIASSRMSRTKT